MQRWQSLHCAACPVDIAAPALILSPYFPQPETVVDRLNLYNSETKPLIDHYDAKGVLQNFTGTESDIIYPQIQAYMKDVLKL